MASNQVFLVIPGVSLMINISLLRKVTNDTNKKKNPFTSPFTGHNGIAFCNYNWGTAVLVCLIIST